MRRTTRQCRSQRLLPVALLLAGSLAGCGPHPGNASAAGAPRGAAAPSGIAAPGTSPTPATDPGVAQARHLAVAQNPVPDPAPVGYPEAGSGQWRMASGNSPVLGRSGRLLRFRVAVERDISVDPDAFAGEVVATLGDPRSWTAGGGWRLQRVDAAGPADFTVYLTTPATRDKLCRDGPDRYTSCRRDNAVVLNVARWATGAPKSGAALDTYRQYMVNHEVGHRLGDGHQLCPGSGRPAPVMQQQTLGLHGCTPNAWPYPDGTQYAGRSGSYDDPIPVTP